MSTNPYESPKVQTAQQSTPNEARVTALRNVRISLLIMLIPAVYNFICFNFPSSDNRIDLPIHSVYRAINSIGLVLIVSAIWFFGLTALEFVTGGFHSIVARKSKLDDGKATL